MFENLYKTNKDQICVLLVEDDNFQRHGIFDLLTTKCKYQGNIIFSLMIAIKNKSFRGF